MLPNPLLFPVQDKLTSRIVNFCSGINNNAFWFMTITNRILIK